MSCRDGVDTTYRNKGRVRGGAGDFSWENLKGDRRIADSEYWLGRSEVCEDLWYADGRKKMGKAEDLTGVQDEEEDVMREMLGLRAVQRRQRGVLTEKEVKEALMREQGRESDEHALGLGLNLTGAKKATAQYIENTGKVPDAL
eukprot:TRINITY_DN3319_c1_g1_i1.p4 TRINITY_DN3319_c1_g1~~TRINITY_DN3319_c1_g1_i1.p4  ORF type:complete len:144 (+),score=51.80 TRINITY_DN3319_c1_g1_i1:55-486(+)